MEVGVKVKEEDGGGGTRSDSTDSRAPVAGGGAVAAAAASTPPQSPANEQNISDIATKLTLRSLLGSRLLSKSWIPRMDYLNAFMFYVDRP